MELLYIYSTTSLFTGHALRLPEDSPTKQTLHEIERPGEKKKLSEDLN